MGTADPGAGFDLSARLALGQQHVLMRSGKSLADAFRVHSRSAVDQVLSVLKVLSRVGMFKAEAG